MKRFFLGLVVILVVLVSASVASAASGGPVQGIGQWAGASQTALSASTATQQQPTNTADPVSVLSPGSNGAVAQSNSVGSDSSATNRNSSDQNASQFLAGLACGCAADAGLQAIGQTGAAGQAGAALSGAQQSGADNAASTGAPTSGPAVGQSNSAGSSADASNGNSTTQAASQDPSAGADQVVGQVGESEQTAVAGSQATQTDPQNNAVSVRVLSPGNDGSTTQSNHVDSDARATNRNSLDQSADQTAASAPCGCSGSGTTQAVGQSASSEQGALAGSQATQTDPQNNAISVRVLSPGNGGSTNQSNSAGSSADASNGNSTTQSASQDPSAGADQVVGQVGESEQTAVAGSQATQTDPQNNAVSVRVLSPGNDGSTTQSNHVDSDARATNRNSLDQSADQTAASAPCGCSGSGTTQAVGQSASSEQGALAGSQATQTDPQNNAISVRVLSPGNGGSTNQSNSAGSSADASNGNSTTQAASQDPSAGADQVVGQVGESEQTAVAGSQATQTDPQNNAVSVRVLSPGNDGSTTQSNHVDSDARATNRNSLDQSADQTAASAPCGCSGSGTTQAVGQSASSEQGALAGSQATQDGASNTADPVRVGSAGSDGSVHQSNSVDSDANATNGNWTEQTADQSSAARCGCGGLGIQALGQSSSSWQAAVGLSGAIQDGASNDASPTRVLSPGTGGSTTQSNSVDSNARSSNWNGATQDASQDPSSGIQALGQEASSTQFALAGSLAAQLPAELRCGCGGASGNTADPVRVGSAGSDGSVHQSNSVDSDANATNGNWTEQTADQSSAARCGCGGLGIQALGQSSSSWQAAVGLSGAIQDGASNDASPTRVLSPGTGGSTTQSNRVDSNARSSNWNKLMQLAGQFAG